MSKPAPAASQATVRHVVVTQSCLDKTGFLDYGSILSLLLLQVHDVQQGKLVDGFRKIPIRVPALNLRQGKFSREMSAPAVLLGMRSNANCPSQAPDKREKGKLTRARAFLYPSRNLVLPILTRTSLICPVCSPALTDHIAHMVRPFLSIRLLPTALTPSRVLYHKRPCDWFGFPKKVACPQTPRVTIPTIASKKRPQILSLAVVNTT